jgi:hypothetical protein
MPSNSTVTAYATDGNSHVCYVTQPPVYASVSAVVASTLLFTTTGTTRRCHMCLGFLPVSLFLEHQVSASHGGIGAARHVLRHQSPLRWLRRLAYEAPGNTQFPLSNNQQKSNIPPVPCPPPRSASTTRLNLSSSSSEYGPALTVGSKLLVHFSLHCTSLLQIQVHVKPTVEL